MTVKTLRSGTPPGMRSPLGRGAPQRRTQLVDVREERMLVAQCEMREMRNGDLLATGYASTFEEYEVYGGPENYGWIEQIARKAFNKTMAAKPDVVYLINHAGLPLARTKSGTLKLGIDTSGLAVEALLEKTDPDVLALKPKMERGDVDEMSFAFYVKEQDWSPAEGWEDDPYSFREITELSIHRGDVSVVTFGANPTTSAVLSTFGGAAANAQSEGEQARLAALQDVDTLLRGAGPGDTITLTRDGKERESITITASINARQVDADARPDGGKGVKSVADARDEAAAADKEDEKDEDQEIADLPAEDDEVITVAGAKRLASLDLTTTQARSEAKTPPPPPEGSTLSLADARQA